MSRVAPAPRGLTIITHGFNSGVDDWVTAMADDIAIKAGGTVAQYKMVVDDGLGATEPIHVSSFTRQSAADWLTATSGEVIIKLDWSDLDGGPPGISTTSVADAAADYLFANQAALF